MKINYKLIFSIVLLFIAGFSTNLNAQGFDPDKGFKQINFGIEVEGWGIPIYVGMDFGIGNKITLGPRVSFETQGNSFTSGGTKLSSRSTLIMPSFRGDYHFASYIDGLPAELDFYGGVSLGLALVSWSSEYIDPFSGTVQENEGSSSDLELWLQLGARYYFTEKLGVQLEFASYGNNGSIGLSYKL